MRVVSWLGFRYNDDECRGVGKERMSRKRTDPLRALSDDERRALERLSRSRRAAAARRAGWGGGAGRSGSPRGGGRGGGAGVAARRGRAELLARGATGRAS